jgi:pimeloyl-ACP methyl ester carboxylesterase
MLEDFPDESEILPRQQSEFDAIYFGGHYGTIHRPKNLPESGLTVVVVPPIGREATCVYRPFFEWAETLAARGIRVLRYDPLGEGDSLGVAPDTEQWTCWLNGLEQAAAVARRETGARSLVLAGMRIGASLALAADASVRPDALILFAPIMDGRSWLRELRLSAELQGQPVQSDGICIDGVRLSASTVHRLSSLDLTGLQPTGRNVFLAGTYSRKQLSGFCESTIRSMPFDGYSKLFRDPHLNENPHIVLGAATSWLEDLGRTSPSAAADTKSAAAPERPPATRLLQAEWSEEPVTFGAGLRGVLTRPRHPSGSQAVIFGNTGGDPRASCGGFTTLACRALASRGIAALRFDFRSLGESGPVGSARIHVYEACHVEEYRAAAGLLAQYDLTDITLVGVCTGGYHALRAVLAVDEFRHAIAINSWLVWRPGTPLGFRAVRMRDVLHSKKWGDRIRRLARGEFDLSAKLSGILYRLKQIQKIYFEDAACRAVRLDLERASKRGKTFDLLIWDQDQVADDLKADFGRNFRRLAHIKGLNIGLIPNIDHSMRSDESKRGVLTELVKVLRIRDVQGERTNADEATDRVSKTGGTAGHAADSKRVQSPVISLREPPAPVWNAGET